MPTASSRGAAGEQLAEEHLRALGWKLLGRNLRTRWIEVDLLAIDGDVLVGVEVKTRSRHDSPERLVTEQALLRLLQALRALHPTVAPACRSLRADVVAIRLDPAGAPELRHFRGHPRAAS